MWQGSYRVEIARPRDYERCKKLLDRGKHPTFVGRSMFARYASNGGAFLFVVDDCPAAFALINTRVGALMVLCVDPAFRSRGLGAETVRFLKPSFVRAIESAIPWFARHGYSPIGEWKHGRRYRTRVMVRTNLIDLSGRLRERLRRDG